MPSKIIEAFNLALKQIDIAKDFFNKNDIDNSIIYVWNCFENLINCLKDTLNNIPILEHKPKVQILKDYFLIGILKQDYSEIFSKLLKYRLVAEFGPYTKISKTYTKQDVNDYIKKADNFINEIKEIFNKKNIKWKKH